MANPYFQFKKFIVYHDRCAMKVTTDACLFGAWCAEKIKEIKEAQTALDIGTGSGLLSLLIAQKNDLVIDALEIDAEAAQQAKKNITSSPWENRINVINCNATEFFFPKEYDIIFSNPPFYENEIESSTGAKNTAHHGHGLKMEVLVAITKKHLKFSGYFFFLLPHKRFNEIDRLINKHELFINEKWIVSPSLSHLPFRVMIRGCHRPSEIMVKSMAIKNDSNVYSNEFISLLTDYYLHL